MPNWCLTRITINHEDESELQKLHDLIKEWTSKDYAKNGFGNSWLGNVVLGSGVGTVDAGLDTDLHCSGSITYLEPCADQLLIDTETAWAPMLTMWVKVIDKYLPGAEIIYTAEECGNGLYQTNDPCMKDKYYVEVWDVPDYKEGSFCDCEYEADGVCELLKNILKTDETDIEKLLEMLSDSEYSDGMAVHKWDFVELDSAD